MTTVESIDRAERGVESVARALDLLDALADREYGLVELGRATGLRPSTTHRLLATLLRHGYVRRNVDTGKYALGLRPLRLASGLARDTEELLTTIRPFLKRIHQVTHETTHLFLGQGFSVVLLEQLLSTDANDLATALGAHLPSHATAAGKAVHAHTEPQIIADLLSTAQLYPHTQRTLTGPSELLQEFTTIRKRGFAVSDGEFRNGMICIASPVFDQHSRVIGAIGTTHMETGYTCGASVAEVGELVSMTARDASKALGFDETAPESHSSTLEQFAV